MPLVLIGACDPDIVPTTYPTTTIPVTHHPPTHPHCHAYRMLLGACDSNVMTNSRGALGTARSGRTGRTRPPRSTTSTFNPAVPPSRATQCHPVSPSAPPTPPYHLPVPPNSTTQSAISCHPPTCTTHPYHSPSSVDGLIIVIVPSGTSPRKAPTNTRSHRSCR